MVLSLLSVILNNSKVKWEIRGIKNRTGLVRKAPQSWFISLSKTQTTYKKTMSRLPSAAGSSSTP